MSRPKMSTWTLGAIMLIVPTSFYLGTALNRHYAFTGPVSSLPPEKVQEQEQAFQQKAAVPAAVRAPVRISAEDEMAYLQGRLKSLKTSRRALETDLKDNKEKLRRLEERMIKENQSQQVAS